MHISDLCFALYNLILAVASFTVYVHCINYRGYAVGVASRLATVIYVAMVMPILYDNSYSLNNSNLKYESFISFMVDF